jgi:hypothetical protein
LRSTIRANCAYPKSWAGRPPVANIIGDDIAAAVDPLKRGEPGAPTDRPTHGADRYSIRHVGVDIVGDWLMIYFSCVGHRPERILCTAIEMKGPPKEWKARGAMEVLRPEKAPRRKTLTVPGRSSVG